MIIKLFWREKDGFLFDDTHFHEVQKKSTGFRVALIIDIKRKLPFILDKLNVLFFKFYIKYWICKYLVEKTYNEIEKKNQII